MDGSTLLRSTRGGAVSARAYRVLCDEVLESLRSIEGGRHPHQLAIETVNKRSVRSTQPGRTFNYGLENGLQVERRPADDLQHFRRRGLLFQSLAKILAALA